MLTIKTQDYCDKCRRKFVENEPIIIKAPQGIWFCQSCIRSINDTNNYSREEPWIMAEYTKGLEFGRQV